MIENQALRKDLDNKESVIKAKDETIDALKRMNNMLQAQIDNNIKREE
jgi:fructose-specific phosphotransferase system component IIB